MVKRILVDYNADFSESKRTCLPQSMSENTKSNMSTRPNPKQIMSSSKNFIDAMKRFYRKKGEHYNMVGMGNNRGTLLISGDEEDSFWEMYDIEMGKGRSVCLAERPTSQSVCRLDVDISIVAQLSDGKDVGDNLCYTDSQVVELVKTCNFVFDEMLIDFEKELSACLLLEKSAKLSQIDEGDVHNVRIKRGFHLHWPFVVMDNARQRDFIRRAIELVTNKKIFGDVKCPIDEMSSEVNWLLYGSRKPDEDTKMGVVRHEPYVITKAFDFYGNCIDHESVLSQIMLRDPFDYNQYIQDASVYRKMTIRPCGRRSFDIKPTINVWVEPTFRSLNNMDPKEYGDVNVEQIGQLLDILSVKRCEDYRLWLGVGMAVYTETAGSSEGLQLWMDWSMNCIEKFCEATCVAKWKSFSIGSVGVGLLKSWAKQDNPNMYAKWKTDIISSSIMGFKSDTSGNIAKIATSLIGNDLKYSDGTWYEFNGNLWVTYDSVDDGTLRLRLILTRKFKQYVLDVRDGLKSSDQQDQVGGKSKGREYELLTRVIKKLEEPNSLTSIIQMMQLEYSDPGFKASLNKNTMLIATKNGVYDLDKCEFRTGRREDYISHSLSCDYISYEAGCAEILELEEILESFFPSPDIRKYVLDVLCNVFVGNIYMKHLYFWVGTGDNGKTAFTKMFEDMLGTGYCVKLPTTLLSGVKGDAGKASPELVQLRDKRLAFFDEPDHSETLSNGLLKLLTGKDSINPRELYQRGSDAKQFVPVAIYTFVCNREPAIKNPDDVALWERFRVVPFESKFVSEGAPLTRAEQVRTKTFPKDVDFVNKTYRLKSVLLYYLLEHWKRTKGGEIHTPQSVVKASKEYRDSNSLLTMFFKEVLTEDADSIVDFSIFYNKFVEFSSTRSFGVKTIGRTRVIEELSKLGIVINEQGIVGWRFA